MDDETDDMLRDNLWRTLQSVSDWIRVADAKAGAALAIDGALLAITAARLRGTTALSSTATVGSSLTIAVAALSGLLAIWSVVPRTRWLRANSMVHYGTIAAFSTSGAYHKAAVAAFSEPDGIVEALTAHIWTISRSARRKYRLVTLAIQLLVVAMALALASMLVR